ncbi:MAG: translation initiation factor eIF-2B [Calditrichaeota bacterium]|nr:MAG: translation initiation factor eIF-2B [Calditrichota bacterium]
MDIREQYIQEIIRNRESGASELARRCLEIVTDIIWKIQADGVGDMKREIEEFVHALQAARPSMSPIRNLLQTWLKNLQSLPTFTLQEFRLEAMRTAENLIDHSRRAVTDAATNAKDLIKPDSRIMTYSFSSTILALFKQLKKSGIRIVIPESRPLCEGTRLAETTAKMGIETTVITESQIGLSMANIDFVVVGADTVLKNGDVVNKAGTSLLALAARSAGVPFYVAFEQFKQSQENEKNLVLENMAASELGLSEQENLHVLNYYFDVTPAANITAWITEEGVRLNK